MNPWVKRELTRKALERAKKNGMTERAKVLELSLIRQDLGIRRPRRIKGDAPC